MLGALQCQAQHRTILNWYISMPKAHQNCMSAVSPGKQRSRQSLKRVHICHQVDEPSKEEERSMQ